MARIKRTYLLRFISIIIISIGGVQGFQVNFFFNSQYNYSSWSLDLFSVRRELTRMDKWSVNNYNLIHKHQRWKHFLLLFWSIASRWSQMHRTIQMPIRWRLFWCIVKIGNWNGPKNLNKFFLKPFDFQAHCAPIGLLTLGRLCQASSKRYTKTTSIRLVQSNISIFNL